MLQQLNISNYALIDQLQLNFEDGLNIITGETGAGKSILLGALGLILGDRADKSALLNASGKCIIEGVFENTVDIKRFLASNDLDAENQLIIRREISAEGKSRSFINDTPVSLAQLKEAGSLIVDIHSQHQTLLLNQSGFQLQVVDAFSHHEKTLDEYRNTFHQFKQAKIDLDVLKKNHAEMLAEQDYLSFQFNELNEINLKDEKEQELLEAELNQLTHADEIKSSLINASNLLSGGEDDLINTLNQLLGILQQAERFDDGLQEISKRIKSAGIEIKDIASEIEEKAEAIQSNPQRLDFVSERLNNIYRLQQKHRLATVSDLMQLQIDLDKKLQGIQSGDEDIVAAEKKLQTLNQKVIDLAAKISENRKASIPVIEKEIKKLLKEVNLADAVLKIEKTFLPEPGINGMDTITFLFSANKGIEYRDISKVASGGELSRLMLCIKASLAKLEKLPTLILDEIDTGISGETALNVGNLLHDISKNYQLISITHLPQIAGRGKAHFFVYKETVGKRTNTMVKKLSQDERIVEVARMLSGNKPTSAAIANAKELLR